MLTRIEGGVTYDPQTFDVQNRLASVNRVGAGVTTFTYDAAGIRVKTELPNGSIIYTPFPHYEEELRLLPPTTVSLAANGASSLNLPPNTTFTLAWSSSGAQSCAASGSWSGSKAINGSQNISGFASGSRTYTLTCQNAAGSAAATVTVSITPLPTVNLTANGQSSLVLPPGSSFTLAWSSSGAQSCTASGAPQWSGSKPTSGSQLMTVLQLFGSQTYTLTCSNSSGSTSRSVIVTIGEAPPPCEGLFCIESLGNGATGLNAPEGGGPTQLIQRSAYQVAGQAIATRVTSDPAGDNDGLFFIYSDHLGSASVLRKSDQNDPFPGSLTRYLPFGSYRGTAPTQTITDRGYTGHKHNDDLGLIYMNARYYVGSIGRFASADTIVPNPTNPQSYNRYSYVRNNPLGYRDPTGHYECQANGICVDAITTLPPSPLPKPPTPLIKFDGHDGHTWTAAERTAVNAGAWQVARSLYEAGGGQFSSPRDAYLSVYGGPVTFYKTGQSCAEATGHTSCYAQAQSSRMIHVYTNIYDNNGNSRIPGPNTSDRWAVHELGHAFENRVNGKIAWGHVRSQLPDNTNNRNGFAGDFPGWQQSEYDTRGEIFADMFIGWSYGQWSNDAEQRVFAALKADFMATNMPVWIGIATRP